MGEILMCRWQHYPIKLDHAILSLADNPCFIKKVKDAIYRGHMFRTKRFKWNGCWMQVNFTNQMEFFVFPESKLMQTSLLDGENRL